MDFLPPAPWLNAGLDVVIVALGVLAPLNLVVRLMVGRTPKPGVGSANENEPK